MAATVKVGNSANVELKGVLCGTCCGAKQLSLHPERLIDKQTGDTFTIKGFNARVKPIERMEVNQNSRQFPIHEATTGKGS